MRKFLSRFGDAITGVLSGFDRIVFRGVLRGIAYEAGLGRFLNWQGILLKDFGSYVSGTTRQIKDAAEGQTAQLDRPFRYLASSAVRKEDYVRRLREQHPVDEGLICVLSCVEPCRTFEIHKSRESKRLELRSKFGKCLHYYHYYDHPRFGLMHARIQTWFPFTVHVCINGRHWLAKQLDKTRIDYHQEDNCFTWVEDVKAAQRLLKRQVDIAWPHALNRIVQQSNPVLRQIVGDRRYWTVHQSEWASDVMFATPAALAEIYPSLVRHGILHTASRDVIRFLGRKVHHAFQGEIVSDFKDRPEGVRIKHWVGSNSVKLYDKAGSVLRPETTINDPTQLRVLRPKKGTDKVTRQPLRKSVVDIHRRAQLSQEANDRYLDTLAAAADQTPVKDVVADICKHTRFRRRRVRALRPWADDDGRLLDAVMDGTFLIHGFRNADIRERIYSSPSSDQRETQRRRARVTRLLRLLRGHGLICKVPHSHRYVVSGKGRRVITAVLAAREAPVTSLLQAA